MTRELKLILGTALATIVVTLVIFFTGYRTGVSAHTTELTLMRAEVTHLRARHDSLMQHSIHIRTPQGALAWLAPRRSPK